MGLTKQYLKYKNCATFNIINSTWSGLILIDSQETKGPLCAVSACEDVIIWDLRKGEKSRTLSSEGLHQTTCLAKSPDSLHLAAGFKNGSVKIFDLKSNECTVTFNGHKNSVSCLSYDSDGMRLVSGGNDTDVVVWDVINESGLYRLKGHSGVITQARFSQVINILISSSKDTLIKFWDLETQHCFKTIVDHNTEIYDFLLLKNDSLLITGSADMDLRVWNLKPKMIDQNNPKNIYSFDSDNKEGDNNDTTKAEDFIEVTKLGTICRFGKGHVISMCASKDSSYFGCHGTDSKVEIFKIISEEEIEKHLKKREKKLKRKLAENAEIISNSMLSLRTLEDEVKRIACSKLTYPVRDFQFLDINDEKAKIAIMYRNNLLARCELDLSATLFKGNNQNSFNLTPHEGMVELSNPGHRNDVKTICFSADNMAVLSASNESLKVWNRSSLQCFRTITCDQATCSTFALEDRQAIIGTKNGKLEIYDIASSTLVNSLNAHSKSVNALCLSPNKLGLVTGGSDKHVVFWHFEFGKSNNDSREHMGQNNSSLVLKFKSKYEVADEVLCLKYSSDQKYLAIGCLDRRAYIYFSDTMKMFHTLYSHNQPITCVDISHDTNLIATGSGDKDIKLWSMDFGECRKILKVAHDDRITSLQFVGKTHHFFSCGRDGKVKQWDADNFQLIATLNGHQGPVNCLSVCPSGNYVVSASTDLSLRLWQKTDEILVLDEEKEIAREKDEEEAIREEIKIPGEVNKEIGVAGKKTFETLSAMEKLCDSLDLYKEERSKLDDHLLKCKQLNKELPMPAPHLILRAYNVTSPEDYILEIIKKIQSSEIELSLMILPFPYVTMLLPLLNTFIMKGQEVEIVCRCLFFLLRIHMGQIVSNQMLLPVLERLQTVSLPQIKKLKDVMGYNIAGLKYLQQKLEEKNSLSFFSDAVQKNKEKRRKRKAVLTVRT